MRAFVKTASITPREQRSMEKYLNDLSKYDVLTPEEEVELFKEYHSGNEEAFSKIIRHNLRFVVTVAKKYQNMGLGLGDLVNEGNVGLIKAARRFDVSRGFKFISYAVWWIRQSILQALNDKGKKIRVPLNMTANISKVRATADVISQREEREPTVEELADATGLTEKVVLRSLNNFKNCRSLDAPLTADGTASLGDVLSDAKIRMPDHRLSVLETQRRDVRSILNHLPDREATVLSLFYGIGRAHPVSLSEISAKVGVSRERVRQIKDKAIKKLQTRARGFSHAMTFSPS